VTKFNRRDFLRISTAALGWAALGDLLAACGRAVTATSQSTFPTLSPIKTNTAVPAASAVPITNTVPAATATQANFPDLAVTRNGEPEALVRRAVAALGGMERFVAKGADVIVKPNICVAYHSYEYAATTNPWVVGTLVRMCFEAGAGRVQVMDFPFGGTAQAAYEISGIKQQVEAAGGEMVEMPMFKYVTLAIPNAGHLKQANFYVDILKADTLINVPIAKVHSLSRLTLGMKNLMGLVRDRPVLHANLSQNLADIASLVRPKLTVVDAVRVMVSNGPTGGSLDDVKKLDTVVASPDIVAADSYAATLFGLRPDDLGYVVAGTKMGLGRSDLQNLKIEEIAVS
jgi:uncharacterized protein (DUF362 family)